MSTHPRRSLSNFNLSFLDIMFCGFGAVVLLVLIINSNILVTRKERFKDQRAEVMRRELELSAVKDHVALLQDDMKEAEEAALGLQAELRRMKAAIKSRTAALSTADKEREHKRQNIAALQQELKVLDANKKKLVEKTAAEKLQGDKIRRFEGEGNRQYLTGLKLGGKRVLILVDTSASMLDRTVVNIIRRKVRDDQIRRQAPKWQQVVRTVQWLIANLPSDSSLHVYGFNTKPTSLLPREQRFWVPVTESPAVDRMIHALKALAPQGGTSLENAFSPIQEMNPRPDNIILLTDGLPTQGKHTSRQTTVSGEERVKLFEKARKQLPSMIPMNTILFPMEGDPLAASLFWKLAVDSGGSFLTPTGDWP